MENCTKCGKMFMYPGFGPKICKPCQDKAEALFQEVKDYLYDNKTSTINEIAAHFKIKPALIQQWIREERLIIEKGSAIQLFCEICGAEIKTGRYCEKCKNDTMRGLTSLNKKPEVAKEKAVRDSRAKMQFLRK